MLAGGGVVPLQRARPCGAPFRSAVAAPGARPVAARRQLWVEAAKKGGKGGKKGPGSLMDIPKPQQSKPKEGSKQPWQDTSVIMQNLLLIESHFRKVGRPILEDVEISEAAKALWEAPFAVLSHDTSEDPKFVYANATALALFEATWDELIGTPSTRSAEAKDEIQADRSAALAAAGEKGCIEDYEGWRVSAKGTRFLIKRATLFNVEAPSGDVKGQAAVIRSWEYEDGTKGGEGAEEAAAAAAGPPTPEQLAAAEAAVQEQGAAVRALKEDQGKGNNDPEVKAAVEELLARKGWLEQLQRAAAAADAEGEQQAAAAES